MVDSSEKAKLSYSHAEHYLLPEEEKYDRVPEIWEGHNIADFVDPDILKVWLAWRLNLLLSKINGTFV